MKKLNKMLIIVDAPDHSGKTKLCEHLIEKYRFNYYHCGVQENIKQYHNDVINMVFADIENTNNNWVIDRLHLSEFVYGSIFRNGPQYNNEKFNEQIKEFCKENNIIYKLIICLPPKEIVLKGHAERNANGDEMFDTVDKVYDEYNNIYERIKNNEEVYKYCFTVDSNYAELDKYLENL